MRQAVDALMRGVRAVENAMRKSHSAAWLAGVVIALTVTSVVGQSASEIRRDSLSQQSFETMLPVLQGLKANDSLHAIWARQKGYWDVGRKGRIPFVTMPGWISSLSGGVFGGMHLIGDVMGRSGDQLFGCHVFGYVRPEGIVIPRFLVSTEATVISPSEYDRLKAEGTKGIGYAIAPGSHEVLSFRDLHVKETRALSFADEIGDASATLRPAKASDVRDWFLSERAFHEMEETLRTLPPGTSFWDVLVKLGARITTDDFGDNHSLLMRGYLSSERFPTQFLTKESGVYSIWPFGYVKGRQQTPQLVLVFKNDRLLRVSPFTGNWKVSEYIAE